MTLALSPRSDNLQRDSALSVGQPLSQQMSGGWQRASLMPRDSGVTSMSSNFSSTHGRSATLQQTSVSLKNRGGGKSSHHHSGGRQKGHLRDSTFQTNKIYIAKSNLRFRANASDVSEHAILRLEEDFRYTKKYLKYRELTILNIQILIVVMLFTQLIDPFFSNLDNNKNNQSDRIGSGKSTSFFSMYTSDKYIGRSIIRLGIQMPLLMIWMMFMQRKRAIPVQIPLEDRQAGWLSSFEKKPIDLFYWRFQLLSDEYIDYLEKPSAILESQNSGVSSGGGGTSSSSKYHNTPPLSSNANKITVSGNSSASSWTTATTMSGTSRMNLLKSHSTLQSLFFSSDHGSSNHHNHHNKHGRHSSELDDEDKPSMISDVLRTLCPKSMKVDVSKILDMVGERSRSGSVSSRTRSQSGGNHANNPNDKKNKNDNDSNTGTTRKRSLDDPISAPMDQQTLQPQISQLSELRDHAQPSMLSLLHNWVSNTNLSRQVTTPKAGELTTPAASPHLSGLMAMPPTLDGNLSAGFSGTVQIHDDPGSANGSPKEATSLSPAARSISDDELGSKDNMFKSTDELTHLRNGNEIHHSPSLMNIHNNTNQNSNTPEPWKKKLNNPLIRKRVKEISESWWFNRVSFDTIALVFAWLFGLCLILLSLVSQTPEIELFMIYFIMVYLFFGIPFYLAFEVTWSLVIIFLLSMRFSLSDVVRQASSFELNSVYLVMTTLLLTIAAYNIEVSDRTEHLASQELAQQQTILNDLMNNLLPSHIMERMKRLNKINDGPKQNIAESFPMCTILFSDLVSFTSWASKLRADVLIFRLHELYKAFDQLCEGFDVYKVETIGDAYFVSSGCPYKCEDHAYRLIRLGREMIVTIKSLDWDGYTPRMRIGIHSGPVVAGVVGTYMPRYHLFGQTVLIAEHLESSGEPGKLHISEIAKQELKGDDATLFSFEKRKDKIEFMGQSIQTYLIPVQNTYYEQEKRAEQERLIKAQSVLIDGKKISALSSRANSPHGGLDFEHKHDMDESDDSDDSDDATTENDDDDSDDDDEGGGETTTATDLDGSESTSSSTIHSSHHHRRSKRMKENGDVSADATKSIEQGEFIIVSRTDELSKSDIGFTSGASSEATTDNDDDDDDSDEVNDTGGFTMKKEMKIEDRNDEKLFKGRIVQTLSPKTPPIRRSPPPRAPPHRPKPKTPSRDRSQTVRSSPRMRRVKSPSAAGLADRFGTTSPGSKHGDFLHPTQSSGVIVTDFSRYRSKSMDSMSSDSDSSLKNDGVQMVDFVHASHQESSDRYSKFFSHGGLEGPIDGRKLSPVDRSSLMATTSMTSASLSDDYDLMMTPLPTEMTPGVSRPHRSRTTVTHSRVRSPPPARPLPPVKRAGSVQMTSERRKLKGKPDPPTVPRRASHQ